jgi:hypothetical protein
MQRRTKALDRLRELKSQHAASIDEGPGQAPGFTEDEAVLRHSYELVADEALESGVLSDDDLEAEGLPTSLG